jgi:hypothetical protein
MQTIIAVYTYSIKGVMFGKHTQEMEEKRAYALEVAQEEKEKAQKGSKAQSRKALSFLFLYVFIFAVNQLELRALSVPELFIV